MIKAIEIIISNGVKNENSYLISYTNKYFNNLIQFGIIFNMFDKYIE